jgi:hypothetical protein
LLLWRDIHVSEKERIILKRDENREKFSKAHFVTKKKRVQYVFSYLGEQMLNFDKFGGAEVSGIDSDDLSGKVGKFRRIG